MSSASKLRNGIETPVASEPVCLEHSALRACCGVNLELQTSVPELLESLLGLLPGNVQDSTAPPQVTFAIAKREECDTFRVAVNGVVLCPAIRSEEVLRFVERRIIEAVALLTKEQIFIHAATVAWQGRAFLLPGHSWSGKSTLAMALVKAGAVYYSDEYAVLDAAGNVHPYRRVPNLRGDVGRDVQERLTQELISSKKLLPALPVGLVLLSRYCRGGVWEPRALTCRETLFGLLENTIAIRYKPDLSLKVLTQVSIRARGFRAERGDAQAAASAILELVQSQN